MGWVFVKTFRPFCEARQNPSFSFDFQEVTEGNKNKKAPFAMVRQGSLKLFFFVCEA